MKIAIISSSFFPVIDGVTVAVYNRVKRLSNLGYKTKLFCPDYSVLQNIYPDWQNYTGNILPEVEVISLPSTESIGLDFERDVTVKSYSIVLEKLEKFQPNIIHVDEAERLTTRFLKMPGVKFARQHQIPCVAFFHTNYVEYFDDYFKLPLGLNILLKKLLEFIFAKIYNSYNLTLVSSKNTERKLRKMGIKNTKYAELLGCDRNTFTNSYKQDNFFGDRYNFPNCDRQTKLIFIGRLTPDKGWEFALEALANLSSETLEKVAFIIVGDGTLRDRIEHDLKQLTSDVYLLGRVAPEAIPDLLTNSDIFVTTSEKETRGLTVIEAAMAGIPAIAPRAGGVSDTVIDGETGFLYQPQQQQDFLDKLNLLISDYNLRHSMGTKAQELAQKWSWEQAIDNLIEIWQEQIAY